MAISRLRVSDVAGVIPTTGNLATTELGVNTADGILYINNGSEILDLKFGGGMFVPTSFVKGGDYTLNESQIGAGNWFTVLDVSTPVLLNNLALSGEHRTTDGSTTVALRVTKNGNVLPILQFAVNNTSNTRVKYYTGKALGDEIVSLIDEPSAERAALFSSLASTEGIYAENSLKIEIQVVSGAGGSISRAIASWSYQEGTYE